MDMITYARAKKYADKVVATGGNTELIESLVTEGVTKVVAGADADFDTLKEVADWIKNDKTGAAKMQVDIGTLKTDLKNIELTPGPQGPQGDIGPQGPKGDSVNLLMNMLKMVDTLELKKSLLMIYTKP